MRQDDLAANNAVSTAGGVSDTLQSVVDHAGKNTTVSALTLYAFGISHLLIIIALVLVYFKRNNTLRMALKEAGEY